MAYIYPNKAYKEVSHILDILMSNYKVSVGDSSYLMDFKKELLDSIANN